ncbi:glycosyltransferase family 4 protein [Brachyspira pilosicoli]|uniref:glycosyltransferase family 4 protein n=1 Tax=Brachyspira pilosicoli TaxID=52584 RepID=UPI0012F4F575|nr:glycosyltransferase family 1 protein [Brachyspira pilosicoli]
MGNTNKLKIVFSSELLFCGLHFNAGRSGLYFAAYNIANYFLKSNNNIEVYFYSKYNKEKQLKECLSIIFKNMKVNTIGENSKLWLDVNVYFSPGRAIPLFVQKMNHISKYTILYDTMTKLFPKYYEGWIKDKEYLDLEDYLNTSNDYYFSISNNTKNDFIKYYPNINPNHIYITYLAADNNFFNLKTNNNKILSKYNIPTDKKYMFTLCTTEPRKNLIRIIKTFYYFLEKNNIDDMVLVMGGGHWDNFLNKFNDEVKEFKDKIIKIGYVDDKDLPYLYSNSYWFVYTSQYEGFGLPPLEAMACGCPIITSNNSSLPEVVGDAGIMIDWDSDKQHIEAYEKYYFDKKYREEMAKKGLERSKLFSWKKCVNNMIDIMDQNCNKTSIKIFNTEYYFYIKIFNFILTIPKLNNIFSVSENDNFIIIILLGIKISIKKH